MYKQNQEKESDYSIGITLDSVEIQAQPWGDGFHVSYPDFLF